jgi:hypothetical protein
VSDVLSEIPNAIEMVEGLPHPRWNTIYEWINANCAPEQVEASWRLIATAWLQRLGAGLGKRYELFENGTMSLLAVPPVRRPDAMLRHVDGWMQQIKALIPYEAICLICGPHVVIVFDDRDQYYRYISRYYRDGSWGQSLGVCLTDGYVHVAVQEHDGYTESMIIHELTHAWLWELGTPLWLQEGLCQYLPQLILGRQTFHIDHEVAAKHKKFWASQSIKGFWSGSDFGRPGTPTELSYHLAELILRLIISDHPKTFRKFLIAARWEDGGEAAAMEHLGRSLGEVVTMFLGEGRWAPQRIDIGGES